MTLFKLLSISMMFIIGPSLAITMPAPPPELPDTLTKFRTKEQINEDKTIGSNENAYQHEEVNGEDSPFVPGDDAAGVLRFGTVYKTELALGVPTYGVSVVRFYDLQGVPWFISSVDIENQGITAEVTASPSELLVKQTVGATSTKMVVRLENYDKPLVFYLTPVKLVREGVTINTILNSIRLQTMTDSKGYVFPNLIKVPKTNPNAAKIEFSAKAQDTISKTLIDAVRKLKQ